MINDLKLGVRMLRYGHSVKANLAGGIMMVVTGLILQSLNVASVNAQVPGSIFMLIGSLFPIQVLFSLNMSNFVQASPAKKRMQTSVPAVMSGCSMLAVYLLHVLIAVLLAAINPQLMSYLCSETVVLAFFAIILMLYLSACYKYFWGSAIVFFAAYFYIYTVLGRSRSLFPMLGSGWVSLLLAAAVGIVLIAVGNLLQYGVFCLMYKVPLSKMAQAASLRKSL